METAKDAGRAKSGELVLVMLSGDAGTRMLQQDEPAILATVLEELEHHMAGISRNLALTRMYRWAYAEPKSPVGRSRKVSEYRQSITRNSSVILADDYMGMPFTEGAAETGMWAAKAISTIA